MALLLTLTKQSEAIVGQRTWFQLAVKNNGGSAVDIFSVDPVVTSSAGVPGVPFNLGGPYVSPNQNTPDTTTPFNVQIPAAGTAYFTFSVAFFGPVVAGAPATPLMQFQVSAAVLDSDGVVSVPPALNVALNQPGFGPAPGSPPNAETSIGALQFQAPFNSPLTSSGI